MIKKLNSKEVHVLMDMIAHISWVGDMRRSDFMDGLKIQVNSAYVMNCIRWGRDNCSNVWNICAHDADSYRKTIVYMIFSDATDAVMFRIIHPEWCSE